MTTGELSSELFGYVILFCFFIGALGFANEYSRQQKHEEVMNKIETQCPVNP